MLSLLVLCLSYAFLKYVLRSTSAVVVAKSNRGLSTCTLESHLGWNRR